MAIKMIRQGASMSYPYWMTCPHCGYERVKAALESPNRYNAMASLSCGIPNPALIPVYHCKNCEAIWTWEPDNENEEGK